MLSYNCIIRNCSRVISNNCEKRYSDGLRWPSVVNASYDIIKTDSLTKCYTKRNSVFQFFPLLRLARRYYRGKKNKQTNVRRTRLKTKFEDRVGCVTHDLFHSFCFKNQRHHGDLPFKYKIIRSHITGEFSFLIRYITY